MKLKSLVVAVAVLAALSAAVYVAQRPAPAAPADPRLGQPLSDRATIEKAARLRLTDQGKSVTLVRQPDATWRVASYYDFPADFAKLSAFVASLTEAKLQRLVTTSPERIARLEFKDARVELLDATDHPLWSLALGKNAETGGGRYVRFGQEDKAFLANLSVWLDADSKNWADAQLINLKPEEIARVELTFAEGGPVAVSRAKKEEPWTASSLPAGQRVKADKIAGLLGSIGNVRFADTVEPGDAGVAVAKANERVFKLTTFAGQTYTIALGRKPEEKKPKPPAPAAPAAATEPKVEAPKDGDNQPTADQIRPATAGANPGPVATGNGAAETKPAAPEFEITPAGPVFVFIECSDPAALVNGLMQKRAFKISDYTFTALPQKADEIFESVPPAPAPATAPAPTPATSPAPAKPADEKPAEPKKG